MRELIITNKFSSSDRRLSIAEAVRLKLDGADYERGEIETIKAAVENISDFLGDLTEALYKNGSLGEERLEQLISHYSLTIKKEKHRG